MNHKLALSSYDVLCFQETWFNDSTNTALLIANTSYGIYRRDRSSFVRNQKQKGGGVAILYSDSLNVQPLDLPNAELEIQCIRLSSIIVLNLYLPPYVTARRLRFINDLVKVLSFLYDKFIDTDVYIFGDSNASSIIWEFDRENPPFMTAARYVSIADG